MITTISGTRTECDLKAVEIIVKSIAKILKKKKEVVLGLSGGRSVQGIFRLLKEEKNIPWDKVHIFWVDERCVPLDHPDSNYRLAQELFLDELVKKGKLPSQNIHPFDYIQGTANYQKILAQYGGRYDIVLLGVGEDGHVAGLFPHHPGLQKKNTFFTLNNAPKPPPVRMSISVSLVTKAQVALVLFYGEGKKSAYEQFKDGKKSITACPAKVVQQIKEVYVVTAFEE